ncbi:unnamed protein product, partial [Closterium sp. NIES-53]
AVGSLLASLLNYVETRASTRRFTLSASPQQNGIAECRIGLIMEVACTSKIHAAAPYFMWPFAFRYAAHQLNLWPRVSEPETSPTLRLTGKVSDASVFRVWGALSLVRDAKVSKLSSRTLRCVFLGFPTDAPPWHFYHPRLCRVFSSQDVTFDESVCFYTLHPHASHPVPLAPLFLVLVSPPVDLLPPQGPAPSGVSQIDPPPLVEPVEISYDYSSPVEGGDPPADDTAATRRSPRLETPPGFPPRPSSPPPQPAAVNCGAKTAGVEPGGESYGGAETKGEGSRGAATGGADCGGAASPSGGGVVGDPTGGPGARQPQQLGLLETLSLQQIRVWIVPRGSPSGGGYGPAGARAASPGGTAGAAGAGGYAGGATGAGGTRGAAGAGGAGGTAGGAGGVAGTRGTAGGAGGAAGAGGTRGGAGAGGAGVASPGGTGGAAGAGGAGATSPGGATCAGGARAASPRGPAGAGGAGAVGAGGAGGTGSARGAGAGGTRGAGATGPGGASTGGTGAAGAGGAIDARGAGVDGAGGARGATGARGTRGATGAGGAGARGTRGAGAAGVGGAAGAGGARGATGAAGTGGSGGNVGARGAGAAGARGAAGAGGAGGATGVAGVGRASAGGGGGVGVAYQSQPQLLPGSPLPAPDPHIEVTKSLTERREPETCASTPFRACRVARSRPPAVPGTHGMALRPPSVPQRVVLPEPPASSLQHVPDPESDLARAASPTVTRLLATVVTDPDFESTAAFSLVTELVDFAARSRLDYVASLDTESESVCPPSVGGEPAFDTGILEDRQFELE